MKFRKAVEQTPHLKGAWKAGLGALRAEDKPHVLAEDPRRLQGSVDVDTALRTVEPSANRWDFAIAYRHSNRKTAFVYWVETHTGSQSQIEVVLKKLAWLRSWLRNDGQKLDSFEREFVWIASGPTSFTKGAGQVKVLAAKGIRYAGKVLHIPDEAP